jgi:1-acyl-sn-glycerol-3-phosphate acyltransferase
VADLQLASYHLAALPVRLVVHTFFRRVEVAGLERLPEGPALVAANHPNSILDPLLVAVALADRRVRFVAAAFFFRIPVVRRLFALLGVVPVFRREDDPGRRGENRSSFDAVVGALLGGGTVAIFPEGNTFADPRLQEVRTGAARMALQTLEEGPEGFVAPLVPVGLNYQHRQAFRSDVLVLVGEPLDPRDYLELWREDPRAAGKQLTEALRERLLEVTRNLARLEDEAMLRRLEEVFRSEVAPVGESLEARFHQSRRILDAAELFRDEDPEGTRRLESLLGEYGFCLDSLELAGSQLRDDGAGYGPLAVLRFLVRVLPPLVLGAPVAAWGVLHNALPYLIVDPLATRRRAEEPQREAVRKIAWGGALFGSWYAVLAAVVARELGWVAGSLYLLSLPLSGLLALRWMDRVRHLRRHGTTFWIFLRRKDFRARMAGLRDELVTSMEAYAREYRTRRGEAPDPREVPLPEAPESAPN